MSNKVTERFFAETVRENGGRVYRVGGCVRDMLRGVAPKDIDLCVVGMVKRDFKALFPDAEECGSYFPVFRLLIDGMKCEVAFARKERKTGSGYKGFKIISNPKVTIEEDLFRRDMTVNAIAQDSLTGEIIDPFQGARDIRHKMLRATGPHFSDDPMRAIRLAGQAARLEYEIDGDTLKLAAAAAGELGGEPVERIFSEWMKVLAEARLPARFFRILAQLHLLPIVFREIADLPADEFNRAMECLDAVAGLTASIKVRFAVLGLMMDQERLFQWNSRMTLPAGWLNAAVAARTAAALLVRTGPEELVAAVHSLRRGSLGVEEFDVIAQAALPKIPALKPLKAVMDLSGAVVPVQLKGKEIGQWLRQQQVEAIDCFLQKHRH